MNATNTEKLQKTKRLQTAFRHFQTAAIELNSAWKEIYSDKFNILYPFNKEFTKMSQDIDLWTADATKKLKQEASYLSQVIKDHEKANS